MENGKDAYIGETLRSIERPGEHKSMQNKYKFQRIHFITADFMEETPAKHFERLLIRLMKADKKFDIRNRNNGNITHYQRSHIFELYFDKLWTQLTEKNW